MNVTVLGSCSICGGRVTVPLAWWSTVPPTPTCERCGATERKAERVIQMEPRPDTVVVAGPAGSIVIRSDPNVHYERWYIDAAKWGGY